VSGHSLGRKAVASVEILLREQAGKRKESWETGSPMPFSQRQSALSRKKTKSMRLFAAAHFWSPDLPRTSKSDDLNQKLKLITA
jgi:hypothetical protein